MAKEDRETRRAFSEQQKEIVLNKKALVHRHFHVVVKHFEAWKLYSKLQSEQKRNYEAREIRKQQMDRLVAKLASQTQIVQGANSKQKIGPLANEDRHLEQDGTSQDKTSSAIETTRSSKSGTKNAQPSAKFKTDARMNGVVHAQGPLKKAGSSSSSSSRSSKSSSGSSKGVPKRADSSQILQTAHKESNPSKSTSSRKDTKLEGMELRAALSR